jgi:signal transduction histidine kinase
VREKGEVVAALVHDRGVLADAELRQAVLSTARLAVANRRLQADIVARARDVAASRQRIVLAADAQRRALEAELRATAGRRLEAVSARLEPGPLLDELERIRGDLERLARGLHPTALTEGGLRAGLSELVAGSPLAVQLDAPDARFPEPIEAGAYFVAAEALANAAKHAGATRVSVGVHVGERLTIDVVDDGTGGASFAGSGLIGIRDRTESLGGTLTLAGGPGEGTRVVAEFPLP